TYADALIHASDHLPVRVDIQLPAMISVDTTPINFGTVILGATLPQHDVSVSNPATAPADNLDYSFTGSVGFQVPAGSFSLAPGADANTHTLKMGTGGAGNKVGTATINSDAIDSPSTVINLSGTVLRHAVASLDSSAIVASETI